jgi:hypothetical protein
MQPLQEIDWQRAWADAQQSKAANVVCMKWGSLYGPEWVNRLYGMVRRHTSWSIRFVCLTDDPAGIRPEVECLPFPPLALDAEVGRKWRGKDDPWWRKLTLYAPKIHDLTGMTLYLDMDVMVVGDIDALFEFPGRFCMMRIWRPERFSEKLGNSSVVRTFVGAESYVLDRFLSQPHDRWDAKFGGHDQRFVSDTVREISFFPNGWCVPFKTTLPRNGLIKFFSRPRLPPEAKIVVFSGLNTPPAAMRGEIDPTKSPDPARRAMRFRRRFRPAPWIGELWAD